MSKKIYLAGPLGFSEAGRLFYYEKIIPALEKLGYEIFDPWKVVSQEKIDQVLAIKEEDIRKQELKLLDREMFLKDLEGLKLCDGVFAVLDGVDVDSGTASEIGIAFNLGKPILGYRGDFRLSSENIGVVVNLFVEGCIRESGGEIIRDLNDFPKVAYEVFGNPGK